MSWQGYLIKKTVTVGTTTVDVFFPDRYIALESYDCTPNQREEIKAYRDDNTRNLTRITAQGKKTKITFKTRKHLHLAEKMEIQNFFTSSESDPDQRKIYLTVWNDETNDYFSAYFYRPNMKYPIYKISDTDIIYNEFQFELIEY
jgi:hypothetical protein